MNTKITRDGVVANPAGAHPNHGYQLFSEGRRDHHSLMIFREEKENEMHT